MDKTSCNTAGLNTGAQAPQPDAAPDTLELIRQCVGDGTASPLDSGTMSDTGRRTLESVYQFTEMYPPQAFDEMLDRIAGVLATVGIKDKTKLKRLAEYVFADMFVGSAGDESDPS